MEETETVDACHVKMGDQLKFGERFYRVTEIELKKPANSRYFFRLLLNGSVRDATETHIAFKGTVVRKKVVDLRAKKR